MQIIANNKAAPQLEMARATFRWLRKSNARNLTDYAPQINAREFILACVNSTASWVGHSPIKSKCTVSISLIGRYLCSTQIACRVARKKSRRFCVSRIKIDRGMKRISRFVLFLLSFGFFFFFFYSILCGGKHLHVRIDLNCRHVALGAIAVSEWTH